MKPFSILLIACLLLITPALRGQDAAAAAQAEREAAEERYKRLNSAVEDLLAAQTEQQKRIATLAKELESLREQQTHPNTSYASQEDLKRLAEKILEIDKKREADKELILKEIGKLGKNLSAPATRPRTPIADAAPSSTTEKGKGYEYEIESGDTLSVIVLAYQKKNIKVTLDQISKANPGLNPNKLKVGQKIWIPAPDKQ